VGERLPEYYGLYSWGIFRTVGQQRMRFSEQTVIVTGAASGIGRATAQLFAA
jgi:NADPH:quinone reductase-like Zn-dependent oxidoreductase